MLIVHEEKFYAIVDLLKTIWAPSLVALISYFIARLNIRIKKVEIQGNAELRARELYFNSLQKKLEETSNAAILTAEWLSERIGELYLIKDEEIKKAKIKGHIVECKKRLAPHYSYYEDIYEEIETSGLATQKMKDRTDFIKTTMETDVDRLPSNEYQKHYDNFLKAMALLAKVDSDMIEKKRDEIFSKYLKKKRFLWFNIL